MHWHPNTDEWQYYMGESARMRVFASEGKAWIFDYQAGMLVRSIICHGALHRKYCAKLLRSLMFKSSRFQGT
jgi:oxalate decarboxylase/phosphoglucose isomerase-like protein (cupin superfamily)